MYCCYPFWLIRRQQRLLIHEQTIGEVGLNILRVILVSNRTFGEKQFVLYHKKDSITLSVGIKAQIFGGKNGFGT